MLRGGEKEMLTIFFIGTTIIASVGWLCYWVGSAALAKYINDKGYTPSFHHQMGAYNLYQ